MGTPVFIMCIDVSMTRDVRSELPADLVDGMEDVCDGFEQCAYDVSMTRNINVGKYTMEALKAHELAEQYTDKGRYQP